MPTTATADAAPKASGDAQDYPEQSYYPSAKVRLAIRFESFGKDDVVSRVPAKPVKNAKGINDQRAPLEAVNDPTAPPGITRLVLQPKSGSGAAGKVGAPTEESKSADGKTHYLEAIIPRAARWGQNGLRDADTLELELNFIDLPLDPRVVRACAVEFYFGTVPAADFAAGIRGERSADGQRPLNLVADQWYDTDAGTWRSNKRFEGWVEQWAVEFTDNGEPTVRLTCKDNRTLLIHQEVPPKLQLDPKVPMDQAFAGYLAHFPQFLGLSIEYRPSTDTPPTFGDALSKTAYIPGGGLGPSKGGGAADSKLSVWDFLTDKAGALGHIIRMEGSTLVIQRSRTLYSNQTATRAEDPFVPRNGAQFRRFVFGRNLISLRVERSYDKHAPANVEVRCYLPEKKSVLVGRFPDKAQFLAMGLPGDGGSDQKWVVHQVTGIRDVATLVRVAQNIYESVGRNELKVHLQTKNLASFGGGNDNPDILDMRPGDPFELLVARSDDEMSTVNKIEQSLVVQSRAAEFLEQLGFPDEFANAYAKAYTDSGFQQTFRSRKVGLTWSIDEGASIDIEGINYTEVRIDRDDSGQPTGGGGASTR